jgi:hypothetical protein
LLPAGQTDASPREEEDEARGWSRLELTVIQVHASQRQWYTPSSPDLSLEARNAGGSLAKFSFLFFRRELRRELSV